MVHFNKIFFLTHQLTPFPRQSSMHPCCSLTKRANPSLPLSLSLLNHLYPPIAPLLLYELCHDITGVSMRYHSPVTTLRPLIPPVGFPCCMHYVQALQMGNQSCWFSRKGMRAFPMSYWMYFFMMCLSQPLSPCSVDYTSPSTTSLTNWSTTSLPDYRSSSPSLVIPSLKLSSPHWPPIWWSCFCIPLLGGSCFLQLLTLR